VEGGEGGEGKGGRRVGIKEGKCGVRERGRKRGANRGSRREGGG